MEEEASVWKSYEKNGVTHSAAHHIGAIADLIKTHGYARVSDVAKMLNITRGSASLTLKSLKKKGLVKEDENRFLLLSEDGQSIADSVHDRNHLLLKFFSDVLNLPEDQARIDACKTEHLIDMQTAHRLSHFLQYFESDRSTASDFRKDWLSFKDECMHDSVNCPLCSIEEDPLEDSE